MNGARPMLSSSTRPWRGSSGLSRIRWDEQIQIDQERAEVIGVVRDSKYDEATERPRPFLYRALAQHAQIDRETLIVRGTGGGVTAAAVQAEIRRLDAALPVFDLRSFETVLRDRADKQRGISALFAAFGLLALMLASLGLYGGVLRGHRSAHMRWASDWRSGPRHGS